MHWGEIHRTGALVAAGTVVIGTATVVGATGTDETGPILAFAAALIVVLITAYTTDRRQRHQLEHDREQKALDRRHSRLLHDLDEMRRFLDEAIKGVETHLDALDRYVALMPERWEEHAAQHRWEAIVASREASMLARRLDLRVDPEHALCRSYQQTVEFLSRAGEAVADLPPWSDEQHQSFDEAKGVAMGALAAFTAASRAYLGAQFSESIDTRQWEQIIHAHLDAQQSLDRT